MSGPLNGAGNNLREKAYEERKIQEMLRRNHFPSIDVNGVAHSLKRVKGNPHRKDDIYKMGLDRNIELLQQ